MRQLLELFLAFLQIGVTAFGGGYAAIPLIQSVIVHQQGWLNLTEMADILAISQMTPGPIAINAATFVGAKLTGIAGSIIATLANILPQTLLMLIFGRLVFSGHRLPALDRILGGLRPAVIGLITSAAISIGAQVLFPSGAYTWAGLDLAALLPFVLTLLVTVLALARPTFRRLGLLQMIGLGAGLGLAVEAVSQYLL